VSAGCLQPHLAIAAPELNVQTSSCCVYSETLLCTAVCGTCKQGSTTTIAAAAAAAGSGHVTAQATHACHSAVWSADYTLLLLS
jgi:hypothetical protein